MDRRLIELQIRAVMVTFRIERRRRDGPTMAAFGARARAILSGLDAEVLDHPDLGARLIEARQELDSAGVSAAVPQRRDAGRRAGDPVGDPRSSD